MPGGPGSFFADQVLFDRGYLVDLARRGHWMKIRHDLREFSAWMTEVEPGFFEAEFRGRMLRALPPRWLFRAVKQSVDRWRANARYPSLFTKAFRERARACASARFAASERFVTAHAEQFHRHATAGHYVSSIRLETGVGSMYGVDVRYPFRDRDLVAFLMAIPGDIVNWQGVPKGLLRHALSGVLPDAIRDRRWKADFTELTEQSVHEDRADLPRLLSGNCRMRVSAGLVDGTVLEEMLRTISAGDNREGRLPDWRLPDPVGLELWLRHFFGSRAGAD